MALEGKLIADKYRVDAFVAASGLGELYRGTNMLLDKPVSISILNGDSSLSERFFAESKAAAKVSHPNVLNLTDFGSADGVSFAVYEAASGEPLSAAIEREGQLPVIMATNIAKQIAEGLSAAHAKGIVHGNLYPGNVLAFSSETGEPAIKVFGFDTANALNETSSASDPSRFAYLAPEQCSGSEVSDARGDIYSLGAILFEMLAGVPPFTGATPTEVMMHHIEDAPSPLSAFRQDVLPSIEPVILRALAKDPDARYQTADEFAEDLASAASSGLPAAAAVPEGSNNIWKTAFVVLVGVSLLTFALIYMTSVKQTDPTTIQSDANGMPVQPINPATGIEEQNLSNLPPDYSSLGTNTNSVTGMPEAYPGGDGYNPWANGGAPPPGAPIQPGGQVIQVPQGQSPFMTDPNCIMQPSGILLCPVPVTPTPAPKATPTPKATPAANANTGTAPAATPTPRPAATPAKTPAPARTPAANTLDPSGSTF